VILVHFSITLAVFDDVKVRLPAVPRVGEVVSLHQGAEFYVRTVVWYPQGDEDTNEPFVYIVVGESRP
jgi:hypothetical protein